MGRLIDPRQGRMLGRQSSAEQGEQLLADITHLLAPIVKGQIDRQALTHDRLDELIYRCYGVQEDLEDVEMAKEAHSKMLPISTKLYETVIRGLERWREEVRTAPADRLRDLFPRSVDAVGPEEALVERLEGVVHEFIGPRATVILAAHDIEEERVMATATLRRAGVVHEGQPFEVEVREWKTTEGVTRKTVIRATSKASHWRLLKVRPDLNVDKFRAKR